MNSRAGDSLAPFLVFLAYARVDARYLTALRKQLAPLRRADEITDWYDGMIVPGQEWEAQIVQKLEKSDIILLLVTSDFIYSDYCYSKEMTRAIERHRAGTARVVPIIVRDADWRHTQLRELQALPDNARPVTDWSPHNSGWASVARGIRQVVEQMQQHRASVEPGGITRRAQAPEDSLEKQTPAPVVWPWGQGSWTISWSLDLQNASSPSASAREFIGKTLRRMMKGSTDITLRSVNDDEYEVTMLDYNGRSNRIYQVKIRPESGHQLVVFHVLEEASD